MVFSFSLAKIIFSIMQRKRMQVKPEGTRNGKRIRLMQITSEPNLVILFSFRDKNRFFNEGE